MYGTEVRVIESICWSAERASMNLKDERIMGMWSWISGERTLTLEVKLSEQKTCDFDMWVQTLLLCPMSNSVAHIIFLLYWCTAVSFGVMYIWCTCCWKCSIQLYSIKKFRHTVRWMGIIDIMDDWAIQICIFNKDCELSKRHTPEHHKTHISVLHASCQYEVQYEIHMADKSYITRITGTSHR